MGILAKKTYTTSLSTHSKFCYWVYLSFLNLLLEKLTMIKSRPNRSPDIILPVSSTCKCISIQVEGYFTDYSPNNEHSMQTNLLIPNYWYCSQK